MAPPRKLFVQAGQRFGQLTVIDPDVPARRGRWRSAACRCDCGGETVVWLSNLIGGHTLSCSKQCSATVHGLSDHPLYSTWKGMLDRCENPACKSYPGYGGRGIRVCDRWHDVAVFISDIERWLGPRPAGMSLDRMMNDHDYRLDNVRWADAATQARNRRPLRVGS